MSVQIRDTVERLIPVSLLRERTSWSPLLFAPSSRPGRSVRTGPCRPSFEETVERGRRILPSIWGSPVPPRQPGSAASWGASRYARVVRSGARSCGAAPILALASALIRSCSPACSIRQNTPEWTRPGSVRPSWINANKAGESIALPSQPRAVGADPGLSARVDDPMAQQELRQPVSGSH